MNTKPVLVVHGIANHNKAEFEQRVATLQNAIISALPHVRLIPVFWGDLGGRATDLSDCLPQLKDGQWSTRAEGLLSISSAGKEVRSLTLTNQERASLMLGPETLESVRTEPSQTTNALADALATTKHLQKIDDPELLRVVGNILNEALSDESSAGDAGIVSTFEVRNRFTDKVSDINQAIRKRVEGVITGIDKLVGKLVEDRIGSLNQRLRSSLMNGVAATLGDIVAYHSNKRGIQERLWEAIHQHAPGYGTPEEPISVVAHSLGGLVSFDAMVVPANGNALCVDSFVTFGSQPAFFAIIDPRPPGTIYCNGHPITLPKTIGRWINLWNVVDILAFTASTVFRLSDGSRPRDIPVQDPLSAMLNEKLWLHSIYWTAPELTHALVEAFQSTDSRASHSR